MVRFQGHRIHFPYPLLHIETFELTAGCSVHAKAVLQAILPEEEAETYLFRLSEETVLRVEQEQKERVVPVFCGYVTQASLETEGKLYRLKLTALSFSAKLDTEPKSRSFFQKGITYEEILQFLFQDYPKASFVTDIPLNRPIDFPILQYQETDWEFIKRLLSLFEAVVYPNLTSQAPSLCLGHPNQQEVAVFTGTKQGILRNLNGYVEDVCFGQQAISIAKLEGKQPEAANELYFTVYVLTSRTYYPVGSMVEVDRVNLMVVQSRAYVEQGELWYESRVRWKDAVLTRYQENKKIAGVSLLGEVKDCKGNMVSIDLAIDRDDGYRDGGKEDYYFPYAIESKAYYCMPVRGAQVHLYFPTGKEWEVLAVNSLRTTAQGKTQSGQPKYAKKTEHPEEKSLSNPAGASLNLTPREIKFTRKEEEAVQIQLKPTGEVEIQGEYVLCQSQQIQLGTNLLSEERYGEICETVRLFGETLLLRLGEHPLLGIEEMIQLLCSGRVTHQTYGAAAPPAVRYDESELRKQEEADAEAQNQQIEAALIERKRQGMSLFGSGALGFLLGAALTGIGLVACVATGGIGGLVVASVGSGMALFCGAEIDEGIDLMYLAEGGDLTTSGYNPLRSLLGEPAYHLLRNGLVIAGSVMFAGPSVLVSGMVHTGIAMAFDLFSDGTMDVSLTEYMTQMANGCMTMAISGPLGKLGDCNPFGKGLSVLSKIGKYTWNVGVKFLQQTTGGILGDLTNGVWDPIGNLQREGVSSVLSSLFGGTKWEKGVDIALDTAMDAYQQLEETHWDLRKIDLGRLAQTMATSFVFNTLFGADPVDCVRGRLFVFQQDLTYQDLYGPLVFARRYDSRFAFCGTMGMGWIHEWEGFLFAREGKIHAVLPDAHQEIFSFQADGSLVNDRGGDRGTTLTYLPEKKQYALVSLERERYRKYTYNRGGQLIQIAYQENAEKSLVIRYQKELEHFDGIPAAEYQEIATVTTPGGHCLQFTYENHLLTKVNDAKEFAMTYRYDAGRLVEASYPGFGRRTYQYDAEGRLTAMDQKDGRKYIENAYDAKGRVVCQRYPDGTWCAICYREEERVTVFTYSDTGRTEMYHYNDKEEITKIECGEGRTEERKYNEQGRIIEETDRNGNRTKREYDAYGCLLWEERPDGLRTDYAYDAQHHKIRQWDNEGSQTEYRYDTYGNLLEERTYLGSITSAEPQAEVWATKTYTYDAYGRRCSETDALGHTKRYWYDNPKTYRYTKYQTENGEVFTYTQDSFGNLTSITSEYGTVRYRYSVTGKVTHFTNGLGHTTRQFLDPAGNRDKRILPNAYDPEQDNGEGYRYTYDYMGHLVEIVCPDGSVQAVQVDRNGNLRKRIHPEGYAEAGRDGWGTEYAYDESLYRIKERDGYGGVRRYVTDANGNITRIIQPEEYAAKGEQGAGLCYTYDACDRLTAIRTSAGEVVTIYRYDKRGRMQKEISGEWYREGVPLEEQIGTRYRYNEGGWLLEKRSPVEEREGTVYYQSIQYDYDRNGNRIREKRNRELVTQEQETATEASNQALTLFFTYDAANRQSKVTDSLGAAMEYGYDSLNQVLWERKRIGKERWLATYYQYDAACHLMEKTEQEEQRGGSDNSFVATALEPRKTQYTYDKNGNLLQVNWPEGGQTEFTYDKMDRVIREVQNDTKTGTKRTTSYRYDRAGNPIEEKDGRGRMVRTYDRMDRLVKEIDREGGVTCYRYDKNSNLKEVVDAETYAREGETGAGYRITYDLFGRITEIRTPTDELVEKNRYSITGRLVSKADSIGLLEEYHYNLAGNLIELETPKAKERGKARQKYTYDANGAICGIEDGEGNRTTYEVDAWGRITTIHQPEGSEETFSYDYAGNVIRSTDGNGATTQYGYTGFGEIEQIIDPEGNEETYRYDREGRRKIYRNRNGQELRYAWNLEDNLIRKDAEEGTEYAYQYNAYGQVIEAKGGGRTYTYEYTPNGWLKHKYQDGRRVLRYHYTKTGQIKKIQDSRGKETRYEYGADHRIAAVFHGQKQVAEYTYYPDGRIKEQRLANGIQTLYTYDHDRNVAALTTKTKDGTVLLSYTYTYDGNDNQISREGSAESQHPGKTEYTYDSLQRLTEVIYPGGRTEQFAYDLAGNRIFHRKGERREEYRYDSRNRLKELLFYDSKEQGKETYTYDVQGNLLQTEIEGFREKESYQKREAYQYNAFQQAIRVERTEDVIGSPISILQENCYDAEEMRYAIWENGRQTTFQTDGWKILEEESEEGNQKSLIWGNNLLASEKVGKYFYYHSNAHGDIELLTEETGRVTNHYQYEAFGGLVQAEEEESNRFRYSGEVADELTGQYYLRARYYCPRLGRFTQEDSYRGDGLNLYAYCRNNPVFYIDPSGYKKDPCEIDVEGSKKEVNEELEWRSGIKIKEVIPPGSTHPVEVYTDDFAQINRGKVDIYMRGEIKLDIDAMKTRIKEIETIKKTQLEIFNKNMQSELKSLNDQLHNYQRSQEMSRTLNNAGIANTVENNQMIVDNLLGAAKKIKNGNTETISFLSGPNGKIQVVSKWKILDDGTPYLATVILKPVK